jgi:hypothetical protein
MEDYFTSEEEEEEEEEEEGTSIPSAEGLNEGWLEQKKRADNLAGDVEVDLSGYTCIAAKEMSDGDGRDVLQAATHHAREATRLILLAAQSGCHRRQELLRAKAQAMARLHMDLQALVKTTLPMVERGEAAMREAVDPLFGAAVNLLSYAELSRCSAVSRSWRRVLHNAFKSLHILSLRGFTSVTGADVLRALARTPDNLKLVDLSGCSGISARGMGDILHHIAVKCAGVTEIDVSACREEAVLRAVAIRARAVYDVESALDLYARLKSDGQRCPLSKLRSILNSTRPHLVFDTEDAPFCPKEKDIKKNFTWTTTWDALFRAVQRVLPGRPMDDVVLLLTLSFTNRGRYCFKSEQPPSASAYGRG